jgi:MYXO-CTERM domain-containing protein
MIGALTVALALSQYVRTTELANASKCLWWNEKTTINWAQSDYGNPETSGDTEFTAFEKAFATWQAQLDTCGSLTFKQGARTTTRQVGYYTNTANENVMLFRTRLCTAAGVVPANSTCWKDDDCGTKFDCWQFSTSAIAMTTTSYDPDTARILDADIELNARSYIFTTVDSPVCVGPNLAQTCVSMDVQNTVTHEVGHLLGLGHIALTGSTMAARADPGEISKRVLDPGSKQFICDVYPKGAPAKSCVLVQVSNELGAKAPGCATEPGLLLTVLGVLGLRRRRR